MRYVAGTVTHIPPLVAGWRPRGGHEIHDDGTLRAWAVGHDPHEVRHAVSRDGTAEVIVVGSCLADVDEIRDAADASALGPWHAAGRLPGTYLGIVRVGRTVRIMGDRAATVQVHWAADADRAVAWSTSAAALAALTGAAPDLVRLLAEFTTWGVEPGADGLFEGVRRVPPGAALTLAPDVPPAIERLPAPSRRSFAASAAVLREEVSRAVGRRVLAGEVWSTDLSGGVDSSTIACVAAAHTDLAAVTYVDSAMAGQDDSRYAAEIAATRPSLTQHVVDGRIAGSRHFDRLTEPTILPATDAPALSIAMLGILGAQLAPAVAAGSTGHLNGWGGDNVLDAFPSPVDRYRAGDRLAALRNAHYLARHRRTAAHPLWRAVAAARNSSHPQALTVLADTVLTGDTPRPGPPDIADAARWCGRLAAADWLTPVGRAALAGLVGVRAAAADPTVAPGALRERLALEATGAEHAHHDTLSRALWGLPLHAPFLDARIVDVCHAVPSWERRQPGDFKPLARAAFTGLVHAPVLARRTKTPFNGVYDGLRENAPSLRRIVGNSALAAAGLLDTDRVLAGLDRTVHGDPAYLASVHALIAAEVWLASLPAGRDAWWEPTPDRETSR